MYDFALEEDGDCSLVTALEPVNAFLALLYSFLILLLLGVVYRLGTWALRTERAASAVEFLQKKGLPLSVGSTEAATSGSRRC